MELSETQREKFTTLLRNLKDGDIEGLHAAADDILCEVLNILGYSDIVQAYDDVPKWYA